MAWRMLGLGAVAAMVSLLGCQAVEPPISGRQADDAVAPTQSSPNQSLKIVDWWETAGIEHKDRQARLQRLASLYREGPPPRFYEYVIPKQELDGAPVDVPVLRVVFPERVFFDTDKTEIRSEAEAVLKLEAESLQREPPDVALFVAGHTDSRGSEAYNYNLSVDRANSVARALLARGVGQSGIWRVGFGEAIPLSPNSTPAGMAVNRRVEFLFAAIPRAAAVWLARQTEGPCFARTGPKAAECKRSVSVRKREYVAVPVTTVRTTRGLAIDRQDSIAIGRNQPEAIDLDRGPPAAIDIGQNQKIKIDLNNDTITIEKPSF